MTDISRFCKCFSSVICCRPCRGKTMLWSRTFESLQWKCNVAAEKQKCDFCNLKTVFVRFRLGYICFWCESANFHITFYILLPLSTVGSWVMGVWSADTRLALGYRCQTWMTQESDHNLFKVTLSGLWMGGWTHWNNHQDLCFQSACIYKCNWKYR